MSDKILYKEPHRSSWTDNVLKKPLLPILVLAALCSYLFFFPAAQMALTDPDESFYAETAKEMLARHDHLTPYLYGKPQFEKPILFYWLVELSYKIFGVNEFASRFPSGVFGLLGVIGIYLFGGLLFNKRVGFFSAIAFATGVEYIALSRACVTDMVLATFMLFGVLFFFYGAFLDKGYFYILSSAAFALATLTKGPIAIVIPVGIMVLYLIFVKDLKAVKTMPLALCVLTFVAIALPWYLAMYRLHGKDFIDVFFGFHNITRFTSAEHKIGSQVYYNIPVVFGGFFPWSAFLPFGFWHIFKKCNSPDAGTKKAAIFTLLWFFVIFLFFSASRTKLPTYIFPSFLSLALITGVLWDDFLKRPASRNVILGVKASFYFLTAAVAIGIIAIILFINFDYPPVTLRAALCGAFFAFGIALSAAAFMNKEFIASFFLIAYSVALFLYPANSLILPYIERYEASKEISQKLAAIMNPGDLLGSETNYIPGIAFYTGIFAADADGGRLADLLRPDHRVWCVAKEKNHTQLYTIESNHFTKPTYIVYQLGKKVIVTNKMPDDGKYMLMRKGSK